MGWLLTKHVMSHVCLIFICVEVPFDWFLHVPAKGAAPSSAATRTQEHLRAAKQMRLAKEAAAADGGSTMLYPVPEVRPAVPAAGLETPASIEAAQVQEPSEPVIEVNTYDGAAVESPDSQPVSTFEPVTSAEYQEVVAAAHPSCTVPLLPTPPAEKEVTNEINEGPGQGQLVLPQALVASIQQGQQAAPAAGSESKGKEIPINTSTCRNAAMRLRRFMESPDAAKFPHMSQLFQGSKAASWIYN